MVNLCTASVGNIAVGSVLQISACLLTHALVVHSPGVKRSPNERARKCHGGRPVLGGHRPGRAPRLLLRGAESRRVSGQTLRFSQGKGVIPPPCFASSYPQSRPRGTGRTGSGRGALLFPGKGVRGGGQGVRRGSVSAPESPGPWGGPRPGEPPPRLRLDRRVSPPLVPGGGGGWGEKGCA